MYSRYLLINRVTQPAVPTTNKQHDGDSMQHIKIPSSAVVVVYLIFSCGGVV